MPIIGIRISPEYKQALMNCAKENDTTLSHVVRRLIYEYVGGVSPCETRTAASNAAQGGVLAYQKEENKE